VLRNIISLFFVFIIGCIFLISITYAKWAYAFVVYDGNTYIVSETHIETKEIDKKIGEVTKYSDNEGTYSGNFSNKFPKGTEYFAIKGININDTIAVKESEKLFIKANYNGKCAGSVEQGDSEYNWNNLILYIVGVILLFGIIYLFFKKRNSR
jgi:ATP-dependent Zn protease